MTRRITLVTGASRGIGRALCLDLSAAGHHVIALSRSKRALEALHDEAKALGGLISLLVFDLKEAAAFEQLGQALANRFGRLDGLVGNAGILGDIGPLQAMGERQFNETIDVNLKANWRLIRVMDPLLRQAPHPRAVFITSGVAHNPRAFWGPYQASKAGLEALVSAWAHENERTSLRVNLFDPGATRTRMRARAMPGEDAMALPAPEKIAACIVPLLEDGETRTGARICARDLMAAG